MRAQVNEEHFAEWIGALRSGRFPQGQMRLRTSEDKFCCLGVMCELADLPKVITEELVHEWAGCYTYGDVSLEHAPMGNSMTALPREAQAWLGLPPGTANRYADLKVDIPDNLWTRDHTRLHMSAMGMNDAGFTFDQIADMFEFFGIKEER